MDTVFKRILRSELDFQDIKVKELALKTGISQRTLEGYLSARGSIPPADVAVKIARALNVSVEYLVTGQKEYAPPFFKIEPNFSEGGKRKLLKEMMKILENYKITEKPRL